MNRTLKFTKMSATGNDFILFDNRNGIFSGKESPFFRKICQRRYSIGADGIILLEASPEADFQYRHFNSDGSLAEMCGNGARAVCYYAVSKKLAPSHIVFEVMGARHEAWVTGTEVKLKLPPPCHAQPGLGIVSEEHLEEGGYVEVGVPHLVIFVKKAEDASVLEEGRRYASHSHFKNRTNVNFVQFLDSAALRVRTYERGVEDETLSCGTGAIASAVISHIVKGVKPPVLVHTTGGDLVVDWENFRKAVFLSGSAHIIYEAEMLSTEGQGPSE
ncbi:MAG: diaminopimelate epimerase [Candidatus Aminicenantes bacterium]|nr:diaminopimelate epimerase [Candidatus Aminicenantes bacterium]